MRPPRLPHALLALLVPKRHRGFLLDDLEEEFRDHVVPGRGRLAAYGWYWRQAGAGILPALRMRRARPPRPPTGGRLPAPRRRLPRTDTMGASALHAVRRLGRSPGFAATAIVTLAIAIGANVTSAAPWARAGASC